jgi:hypothetical protein
MMHVARKAGRRREMPLPNVPLAGVVDIADYRDDAEETAEERADRYEKVVNELAHYLLMSARAMKTLRERKR